MSFPGEKVNGAGGMASEEAASAEAASMHNVRKFFRVKIVGPGPNDVIEHEVCFFVLCKFVSSPGWRHVVSSCCCAILVPGSLRTHYYLLWIAGKRVTSGRR